MRACGCGCAADAAAKRRLDNRRLKLIARSGRSVSVEQVCVVRLRRAFRGLRSRAAARRLQGYPAVAAEAVFRRDWSFAIEAGRHHFELQTKTLRRGHQHSKVRGPSS